MRNKNHTVTIDWILQRGWELAITLTFKKDCTEHREALDKKKRLAGRGTLAPVGTFGTV